MKNKQTENLLNMKHVLEKAKKYEELELASLKDGFDIQFYPIFSTNKIHNLLEKTAQFISYNNNKDKNSMAFVEEIKKDNTDKNLMLIIYFFSILEFTSIGQQVTDEIGDNPTPKDYFPYFDALLKTGYLYEIPHEVFLPEEFDKILDEFSNQSAIGHYITELSESFVNQLDKHKETVERVTNHINNENKEK